MDRFEFKLTVVGDGDNAVEAWNDAVENFTFHVNEVDPCVTHVEVIENNIDDSE